MRFEALYGHLQKTEADTKETRFHDRSMEQAQQGTASDG